MLNRQSLHIGVLRVFFIVTVLSVVGGVARAQSYETEMVVMRDGVGLATYIYMPEVGEGPWPAVLMRTPYGREPSEEVAVVLQQNGVVSLVQETRGHPPSEGVHCVFRCEGDGVLKDGRDTIDWIGEQSWFDGHLVTYGGSALGIAQYLQATATPPDLDAMWVEVATPMLYDEMFFPGGVFRENLIVNWLEGQGALFFLDDLAEHPLADSFWDYVQTSDQFGEVNVPAVHIGGWYDIFPQGPIDAFMGYQYSGGAGAVGKQKLIMGPWVHLIRDLSQVGDLTYPENAADTPTGLDQLFVTWFLHYLGMQPDEEVIDDIPAVQYYVMGDVDDPDGPGNEWRFSDVWPIPAAPARLYLQPGGGLEEACPPSGTGWSEYTYDPADPTPTICGPTLDLSLGAGPCDQRPVEIRDDVLVFSTEIFSEPFEITGRVKVYLFVSIDTPDTDLVVRMTDVYPDGRSMLVSESAARLASRSTNDTLQFLSPGEIVKAVVDLWSTSIIINAGHKLRISVTSSNWPRLRRNPNDGSSFGETPVPTPVNVNLYHDLEHPSYLEVRSPSRDPSEVVVCDSEHPDAGVENDRDGGLSLDGGGDSMVDDSGMLDGGEDAGDCTTMTIVKSGCSCRSGPGSMDGVPPRRWLAFLILFLGGFIFLRSGSAGVCD